jgi:hypothetical protein
MNVIHYYLRRVSLVPALALLVGQALSTHAQTVLVDFGSDTSFRGLSVNNPDTNGNYWNSLQPGLFYENLIGIDNVATAIDLGFDTPVATDSYNGPAGPTDELTLETDVMFTDIDAEALGNLGGSFEGVFDYAAGFDGAQHFPVRFQIQGLNPTATYDLTFFGSHMFSDDPTTVYTVYSDNTYTTPVASTTLLVQEPFNMYNRDRLATIEDVSPQTDNILYVEFVGETGNGGYLNAMQIEAIAGPLLGDYDNSGVVDGADLDVWEGEFGDAGATLGADGDNDGDVDGEDFLIWQRNVGEIGSGVNVAAIPEPAAISMIMAGLISWPFARHRQRRRLGPVFHCPVRASMSLRLN